MANKLKANLKAHPASSSATGSAKYERALILAIETLGLYAAPHSYHAISFLADRPSGWFADDFSHSPAYRRRMPGRAARRAIAKIQRLISPNDGLEPSSRSKDKNL